MILKFLPLIGYNLLLIYYRFEYEENFYKYGLYYSWVQMLLQIGPSLRLGSKCYYGWDFYYAWVQMLLQMGPLLHLGPVITLVPSTYSVRCHFMSIIRTHLKISEQMSKSGFFLSRSNCDRDSGFQAKSEESRRDQDV